MANEKKRIEAIYHLALEKKNKKERSAYLDSACGDDSKLRASVEGLLQAHDKAGDFLEVPPFDPDVTLDLPLAEGPGTRIGRYKLLELIGEGGFGVVYMAQQEEPIRRRVALKIIKLGMDTKQVIARFEAERQALAMMEHPNIAKVLDAGATDTGRPYFVMELVKGIPITEYCDKNNLETGQRLQLFIEVCKAVQHAHQKGIIHRDIKPTNVLITLRDDGTGVPKIIDFGIAKATQQKLTEKTYFTEFKQFIGTLEYMSPEQAQMGEVDVDTRSDIYSLGVLLYELLTGTTPFDGEKLRSSAYDEMLKTIRETEPQKPSTRLNILGEALSDVAKHHQVEPGQLCKIIQGDLDWIVLKTLEKDRTRRYETANELAMDIERHLGDEPVVAGPPSVGYRLRKFVRRNRTAVAVGLVVLASLVVGLALATVGFVQASHERDRAFAAEVVARSAEGVARSSEAEAVAQRQIAENQQNLAEERELTTRRHLYTAHIYLAHQAWEIGYVERALELLDAYIPKAGEEELRSFGWYYLWRLCHGDLFSLPQSGTVHATFSPDGQTIATVGNYDRTVKLWDATSGQLQATLGTTAAWSIAFSPDGSTLATGGHNSGEIKLWNVASRTEQALLHGDPSGTMCLAFSPDGLMLAASGGHWDRKDIDGAVHIWDVATGRLLAILRGHTMGVPIVAFAPDGKTLASGSWDGFVKLWDTATWKELITFETIPVIAFSPDGTILATLDGPQPTIKLRNPVTGRVVAEFEKGTRSLVSLTFSPDGGTLAGASLQPCAIDIWDVASGQLRNVIRGHTHWVWSVSFSPDGKRLVTGSRDGTAKVWELPHRPENLLRSHTHKWTVFWGPIGRHVFDFSPDGRTLVIPGKGDTADLWDVASRIRLASFDGHGQPVTSVAFSADGNVLATGGLDGAVKLWDMATKRELVSIEPGEGHVAVSDLEFSPDGTVLAAARSRNVLLIDVATGREHARLAPHTAEVSSLAFSPDGRTLATTCLITGPSFGSVNLWDTATGKHKARYGPWPNDLNRLLDVAFSADGKVLALGGGGGFNPIQAGSTKLVDVATGREIGRLKGHSDYVTSTAFSPDGKTLATASFDSTVKLWDTFTWQEQMTLKCKGHQIDCIEFSPDGKVLVVGTVDGTVQLFCAAREEDVATRAEEIRARRLTLWSSQKRWDELVDEYSKMIIDNPDDAGLFYQRARAYLEMEKWEEAIADFSKAIELAATCPTDPESRRRLAQTYRSLADVLEKMGRSEDAQQANQKAEEIEKAPIKE